jgi:hypothetical protein
MTKQKNRGRILDTNIARFAVRLYILISRSIISKPIIIFLLYLLLLGTSGTTQSLRTARKMLVLAISHPSLAVEKIDNAIPSVLCKKAKRLSLATKQIEKNNSELLATLALGYIEYGEFTDIYRRREAKTILHDLCSCHPLVTVEWYQVSEHFLADIRLLVDDEA